MPPCGKTVLRQGGMPRTCILPFDAAHAHPFLPPHFGPVSFAAGGFRFSAPAVPASPAAGFQTTFTGKDSIPAMRHKARRAPYVIRLREGANRKPGSPAPYTAAIRFANGSRKAVKTHPDHKNRKKTCRNVLFCEKYTIFALRNPTGCSSARLEYTSGGRVVASSNLVTPTNRKSLIFSRISRIFLLWYIVRKVAVVHKWYINGRHSKNFNISLKYLVVG